LHSKQNAELDLVLVGAGERLALSLDGRAAADTAALTAHLLEGQAARCKGGFLLGRHLGEKAVDVGMEEFAVKAVDAADCGQRFQLLGVHSCRIPEAWYREPNERAPYGPSPRSRAAFSVASAPLASR
jgi:hypothetical protein